MDKENLFIMGRSVNISKDDMEDYNLPMFTHAMNSFKEHLSFKKPILEHFFHKLIEQFVNRKLVNIGEFVIYRIHESLMTTLCNSR
jgi:hypothetical protein